MQRLGVMTTVADPDLDLAAQYAAVAQCEAHGSPVEQAERLRDRLSRCWAPRLKPLIEAAASTHRAAILVGSLFSAAPVRLAACSAETPLGRRQQLRSISALILHGHRSRTSAHARRFLPITSHPICIMQTASCTLRIAPLISTSTDFRAIIATSVRCSTTQLKTTRRGWMQPGDPWALVTVSSLKQDDIAIAQAALVGLSKLPLRVLVTMGPHARHALGASAGECTRREIRAARGGPGQGASDGEPCRARVCYASTVAWGSDGAGPLGARSRRRCGQSRSSRSGRSRWVCRSFAPPDCPGRACRAAKHHDDC